MKKLFVTLSLIAAFTANAQQRDREPAKTEQTTKQRENTTHKKNTSAAQHHQNRQQDDAYLDDFDGIQLTSVQKKKIKALHQRRYEKYPKMKNTKKGLSEKQYKTQVKKVLTKQQLQQYNRKHQ